MIGRGTLLWLALAIVAGAGLFHVSYRVQSLEEELTRVNRDMSLMYRENPRSATFHNSPVTTAPIHTSRKRTLAFGTK